VVSLLEKIDEFEWEIKKDESKGMRVPVRVFGTEVIIRNMQKDRTLLQATNAASLPGIVKNMLVMSDGHEGYGSPIGGVSAFDAEDGIVSPGFCGYDINCGVRVIKTNLSLDEAKPKMSTLMDALMKNVPSGVGSTSNLGFTAADLDKIATSGIEYAIEKGYGWKSDIDHTEEGGKIAGADPDAVSDLAKKRGRGQLGTLGAGNHFVEIQKVEKIFHEKAAAAFGLEEGKIAIMLHSGSRGYGHQVCSDYLKACDAYLKKNNITLADPELSYAGLGSKEAADYIGAMRAAVNFAFVNRQIMMHFVRKSFSDTFGKSADALGMELLYDLSHNIVKLEEHTVDGKKRKLYIHRKGATRAFGPGNSEVTKAYRAIGQPVLIPGSMGTASYVLVGRNESMEKSFGSSCHGAGRVMSRHQALREIPASKTFDEMKRKNIEIRVRSRKLVSEEAEWVYKDVDEVVRSIQGAKISDIVAKMVPLGVTKG
jgi:tRNA-splicing ligase RtcB